jgi:hypothetical protein
MTNHEHLHTAEREFMKIVGEAGLPEPDEVNYHEEDGEIELIWREQKLAVVVECGPDCPIEHDPSTDDDAEIDVPF